MIRNGYAEDFHDFTNLAAGEVSAVSSDDGRDISKSLTNSPRPGRISRESDDSITNRVTFIDEIGVCSNCETEYEGSPNLRKKKRKRNRRANIEFNEHSPDVRFSRKSYSRSSKKELIPSKDFDVGIGSDLRRISSKKLADQTSEASRQRSLKRNSSQRGSRISRLDAAEGQLQRDPCRLQRKLSGSGSHTNSSLVERQNSTRSNSDTPRRKSSVRSARLRSDSRNSSNFSDRFDIRKVDLGPKERRRQKVVLIVIVFFIFFLLASVILVIVTLTNSTFNSSSSEEVRKENEQLMKSFGDEDTVYNATIGAPTTTLEPASATNTST